MDMRSEESDHRRKSSQVKNKKSKKQLIFNILKEKAK